MAGFNPISVLPATNQQWASFQGTADGSGYLQAAFAAGPVRHVLAIQVNVPTASTSKRGYAQFTIGQSTTPIGPTQQPFTPPWTDGDTIVAPVENPTGANLNVNVYGLTASTPAQVFVLYATDPCRC